MNLNTNRSHCTFIVINDIDELRILSTIVKDSESLEYYFSGIYALPAVFILDKNSIQGHLGVSEKGEGVLGTLDDVKNWYQRSERRSINFIPLNAYRKPNEYPEYFI